MIKFKKVGKSTGSGQIWVNAKFGFNTFSVITPEASVKELDQFVIKTDTNIDTMITPK